MTKAVFRHLALLGLGVFIISCKRSNTADANQNNRSEILQYDGSKREMAKRSVQRSLEEDQRVDDINDLNSSIAQSPQHREELLREYVDQLAKHDPGGALIFLAEQSDISPQLKEFGAKIAAEWLSKDEHQVLSYFGELFSNHSDQNTKNAAYLMDFIVEPHNAYFDKNTWLSWINSLDAKPIAEHAKITGHALEALLDEISTRSAQDFDPVKEVYLKNISTKGFDPYILSFAEVFAKAQPDNVLGFVEAIPEGDTRDQAVNIVLETVASQEPEFVAEWLSSKEVIQKLMGGDDGVSDDSFDRLISDYVHVLVRQYPADAETTVKAVRNQDLRKELQQMIRKQVEEMSELQW